MSQPRHGPQLPVPSEGLQFNRKEYRIQRASWLTALALLVAAFLGLFGTGPLSDATASDRSENLTVRYDRFTRWTARTVIQFSIVPAHAEDSARLWIDSSFLHEISIERIVPEPIQTLLAGDKMILEFALDRSAPQNASHTITIQYATKRIGTHRCAAGLHGQVESVNFSQFVFP